MWHILNIEENLNIKWGNWLKLKCVKKAFQSWGGHWDVDYYHHFKYNKNIMRNLHERYERKN